MATVRTGLVLFAALAASLPAHALYKVVGPDGRVTYTDVPPPQIQGRVSTLAPGVATAPEVPLPAEVRQSVSRYPVTLYTAPDCLPCEQARALLRTRGVPHAEKTVVTDADREAWQRVVGGPEAPALMIGSQALRGLEPARWNDYLDAAGYPRTSKLPPGYQFAPAQPLVQPAAPEEARAKAPPASPSRDDEVPTAPAFRF